MFSYTEVSSFFATAAREIAIFPLRDWRSGPGLILRHDVDLDVVPARRLADALHGIGVRSTFFFLTCCSTYNVLAASNRTHLRSLHDDGFEVALHFDPSIYETEDVAFLEERVRFEARVLEDVIGAPVTSLSLHNPDYLGRMPQLRSLTNAYDPRFFGEGRYSSDSRMQFRTPPSLLIPRAKAELVQINLHPEHYSVSGASYPYAQLSYIDDAISSIHTAFSTQNSTYAGIVGDRLHPHVVAHLGKQK